MIIVLESGETLSTLADKVDTRLDNTAENCRKREVQVLFTNTIRLADLADDEDEDGEVLDKAGGKPPVTKRAKVVARKRAPVAPALQSSEAATPAVAPAKQSSEAATQAVAPNEAARGVVVSSFEFSRDDVLAYVRANGAWSGVADALAELQDRKRREHSFKSAFGATTKTPLEGRNITDAGFNMKCACYFLFPREFAKAGLKPSELYQKKKITLVM